MLVATLRDVPDCALAFIGLLGALPCLETLTLDPDIILSSNLASIFGPGFAMAGLELPTVRSLNMHSSHQYLRYACHSVTHLAISCVPAPEHIHNPRAWRAGHVVTTLRVSGLLNAGPDLEGARQSARRTKALTPALNQPSQVVCPS